MLVRVVLAVLSLAMTSARAEGPQAHVVLFAPGIAIGQESAWERSVRLVAEASASDLGLDLEATQIGGGRQEGRDAIRARIEDAVRPDCVLLTDSRGFGGEMLRYPGGQGVDTFLLGAPLAEAEQAVLGGVADALTVAPEGTTR